MAGKSKRYFQEHSRTRSRSPDRDSRFNKSSHSVPSKETTKMRSNSSKFAENKSASERLKKSIVDPKAFSKPPITSSTVPRLTVEEQVKRANAIEDINYNPFLPKTFLSSRTANSINILDIPLPKDDNSWRENPRLLIDQSVSHKIFD